MRKKVVWPDNPLKPKPKEKKEGKIIDWLREQRVKHDYDLQNGIPAQNGPSYHMYNTLYFNSK